MGLTGSVRNSSQGVFIEVEGEQALLDSFLLRIEREKPELSSIQSLEYSILDPVFSRGFEIGPSAAAGETNALILPDIATCDACAREIMDPSNRRYRYPFTNCTRCGPRFTIIESLPYDRPNTSMKSFEMCPRCRAEYEDPADRRFHAQPNACPVCGPRLELEDSSGRTVAEDGGALEAAAGAVLGGKVVAVKGLGGFHLIADATRAGSVETLRQRKHREEKPFALMFPSLDAVRAECLVSPLEERVLRSPQSPIVLLARRTDLPSALPEGVAPGNPFLGVMLPYTPLHHLLMHAIGRPVIATSGNLADEPICIDEAEALGRLEGIADLFLVHDRPIVRHADDSIVRIVLGRELVLRRARGYAPLPLRPHGIVSNILAVGGHLKNTIAVSVGGNVFLSQHIGDLETAQSTAAFRGAIESFLRLYPMRPKWIAADRHPDYASSRYARAAGIPLIEIQHHHAHVAACMAENELEGDVLGVCWDGTGYGEDGAVWGVNFCGRKEPGSPGWPRCAGSVCRGATGRSGSRGARPSGCCTRSWATPSSGKPVSRRSGPSARPNSPSSARCCSGGSTPPGRQARGGFSTRWPPRPGCARGSGSRARRPWSWSSPRRGRGRTPTPSGSWTRSAPGGGRSAWTGNPSSGPSSPMSAPPPPRRKSPGGFTTLWRTSSWRWRGGWEPRA